MRNTGLSPLKPPAQAAAASAGGCQRQHAGQRAEAARACKQSRRSERRSRGSNQWQRVAAVRQLQGAISEAAVRCKNRVATHRIKKLGLYHVSRRDFVARPASLPERERLLVLLRPGPLPTPDAGKALIHTQVLVPASRITAMCRVRNNRIICQSSDPLEGVAITLNQWILLTARAARPDAVAPHARHGTRLPSSQVSRIAH